VVFVFAPFVGGGQVCEWSNLLRPLTASGRVGAGCGWADVVEGAGGVGDGEGVEQAEDLGDDAGGGGDAAGRVAARTRSAGGQVVQGLPVLPWGADLFEVVPGPVPQGVPGERRRVRIPIGGLSFGDPGQGVVPVDLMQVIADTPTWA
jgi:hypothetical protein